MDFVFDRTAEGRVLQCLTIVDDATTEAVAIVPARALGGSRSRESWIASRCSAGCPGRCCGHTNAVECGVPEAVEGQPVDKSPVQFLESANRHPTRPDIDLPD
jgi:hypothetical protein